MDGMCIDKASWQSNVDEKVSAPKLTKQDSAFEAENCQFVWGMQDLTVSDLNTLFQKVQHYSTSSTLYVFVVSNLVASGWLSTAGPQAFTACT